MDMSKVPTADLEHLANGNMGQVSTATLTMLAGDTDGQDPPMDRNTQLGKGAKLTPKESSDYMANMAAFAKDGGVRMFAKTPATDTRKISYTDTGYKPNKPAKTFKELVKNGVQDVVEAPLFPVRMASDIINAPDTVDAVKDTAKSLVTTPLGFVPYVSEMATGRTAADNWLTNPGLGAMTVLGGAELAKTGGPKVADFAVNGARKAAEVTGIPKVMDATANKLYDMTLKQGTTLKPEIRAQNLEAGLEGQYLPNNKGVDKLAGDIHATEQKLGAGIAAGDAAKVTGTLDRAIANVEALREQAKRSANPDRSLALIDAEIERLRGNPTQSPTGDIPITELQKMKVEQGQHIRYQEKMNQAVDPFQTTIDKARVRGLRQEVEAQLSDTFPELADTNRQLGRMYDLQKVLERAASRVENNQGIGIGIPVKGGGFGAMGGMIGGPVGGAIGGGIGTLIGIIEHPAVAPRIALALRRAVKGLSKEEANTIVNNRLGGLKDGLIQREQTVLDSESLPKVSNSNLGDVIPEGYQQTYDWSGKPPAPEPVANPEALPPRPLATNLGDELRPNDYAPVHGWEGKRPAPVVANPEALPPRQSSQMPQVSEQGGRTVPQVEAMTPRVPEGFNPEVLVGNESQLGNRLAPQPHPLRNIPENNGNGGGQGSPVAGLSEAVDTSVSPKNAAMGAYRGSQSLRDQIARITGEKVANDIYDKAEQRLIDTEGPARSELMGPGGRGKVFYGEMQKELGKALEDVRAHAADPASLIGRQLEQRRNADMQRSIDFMHEADKREANELANVLEQKRVSPEHHQRVAEALDNGDHEAVLDAMHEAAANSPDKLRIAPSSPAAHTWQSYLAAHMSRAMKETGDHGKAMKLLGEEWRKDKSKDPLGIRKGGK